MKPEETIIELYMPEGQTISFPEETLPKSIVFQTAGNLGEPVLSISQGKFYALGKEIEDTEYVYERFNEWLKSNKF